MAGLNTSGFQLSSLGGSPSIPSNVGAIDIKSIYDRVRQGLDTGRALATATDTQAAETEALRAQQAQAIAQQAVAPSATQAAIAGNLRSTALASPEIIAAEAAKAQTGLDADLIAEQNRRNRQALFATLSPAQLIALEKFGPATSTTSAVTPLPGGRISSTNTETANIAGEVIPVKTASSEGLFALTPGIPNGLREFEGMTANLPADEKEKARLFALGLAARPSGAAIQYKEVMGPDGVIRLVAVDPRGVGAQVVGTGETYGTGVGAPAAAPVIPATAPAATAAPIAPAAAPAPNVFASPNIADKTTAAANATQAAKLQAERQEKLPKAQAGVASLEAKTKLIDDTIAEAKALVSPFTVGFGSLLDRLPTSDARALKAKIETIRANIGFDALQEMRQNSPTGGALGAVSDYEGGLLQGTLAKLDTGLDTANFLANLDRVQEARHQTLDRMRKAYVQDFNLAQGGQMAAPGAAPTAPAEAAPVTAPSGPPTITSKAQYDALGNGLPYLDAQGQPHIKGGKRG